MNNTLIILLMTILINSIFSINSADFCHPVCKTCPKRCNGKHAYECSKEFCAKNENTCDIYIKFRQSTVIRDKAFKALRSLINFRSTIKICKITLG